MKFWERIFGKRTPPRTIYSFFDGKQMRHVDPMVPYRRMANSTICDVGTDFNIATCQQMSDKDRFDAQLRIEQMTCEMFDIKPFDQGGLTSYEVSDLLANFLTYIDAVKKKRDPQPTAPQPTDSTSSGRSTTKPHVVLSGTPNGSSTDEPTSSCAPLAQPSAG